MTTNFKFFNNYCGLVIGKKTNLKTGFDNWGHCWAIRAPYFFLFCYKG